MINKRKPAIELMRFLAAMMVVSVHFRQFFYPDFYPAQMAFIAVDFFFLVSGYFAMQESVADPVKSGASAHDAVLFTFKKAKKLFPPYVLALIIMFVIRIFEEGAFSLSDTLAELFHFKWEFFMLHMAGFNHSPSFGTDYLLPTSWFISSLMIAMVPFLFLTKRFQKTFSGVIAPVCAVMIYATIIQRCNTIDAGNQFFLGTMAGNYRAFAGLCTGAFVYHINTWVSNSLEDKKVDSFLKIMDVVSWLMALSLFIMPKDAFPEPDVIFWLLPFSIMIINSANGTGIINSFIDKRGGNISVFLGRISLYIYLFHIQIIEMIKIVSQQKGGF